MQAHQLHSLPPFFLFPHAVTPFPPSFFSFAPWSGRCVLHVRACVRACVRAGAAGASSPQQACAPLTLHACVCVPFQGMFSLRAMYAMQYIHHCVFFLFVLFFGVCCCSLVAAGTCKADTHPTQPGICIEHTLVEEAEEKRGGGMVVWVCMVVCGDEFFFFLNFFAITACFVCGWGG